MDSMSMLYDLNGHVILNFVMLWMKSSKQIVLYKVDYIMSDQM